MKKYRQGQTHYYIDLNICHGEYAIPEVRCVFLHSQKTPLPKVGLIIDKMPVDHFARTRMRIKTYASRRKANTALKQLNKQD